MDSERGIVDWLLCTYEENPNGKIQVRNVYDQYMQDIGVHLETSKPVGKGYLGSIIKNVFSGVSNVRLRNSEGQKQQMYRGMTLKQNNQENEVSLQLNDIGDFSQVKALGFFVLPRSSATELVLGYHHKLQINNVAVLTEVRVDINGVVKINTLGKNLDLECVCIGPKVSLDSSCVMGHLSAVTKLSFCKGFEKDYSHGSSKVLRECWQLDSSQTVVYRSARCSRVLSPAHERPVCVTCRKQHTAFLTKQRTCRTESVPAETIPVVAAHQDPDTCPPPPTPEHVTEDISSLLDRLFPQLGENISSLKVLLESQIINLHKTEKCRHRWDPRIIRLCMMLWGRSPKAYQDLRSSGFLLLPTVRLLQYYKNCIEQKPGLQTKMFTWMQAEADRLKLSENGREGGLLLDEMAIQEDLYMQKTGSQFELQGFVDLGEVSKAMEVLKTGKQQVKLATHVLQLVFLGDNGFRFPFAHFPCTEATSSDLFYLVWDAVGKLRDHTFKINYISMDGASTNRSFMKMHFEDSSADGMRRQKFTVENPMPPNKHVVFLMDPSHTFKKIRNNLMKSGDGEDHKRNLLVMGQRIQWKSWVAAYHWDKATNSMRIHQKLSDDHLFPDCSQKMRNHLAEQVLDADMLCLMQSYQRSLNTPEAARLTSVVAFLQNTAALIEVFRDSRPIYRFDDERLGKLAQAHKFFIDWESSVHQSISQIPNQHKKEREQRKRHMMSEETREDLSSAVVGLTELCRMKICRKCPGSVVPARVNTDLVENVFCQQRGIYHGNSTNPNYHSYCTGINAVVLGQASNSRKRTSNCGASAPDPSPISLNVSLRKRPKKCPRL